MRLDIRGMWNFDDPAASEAVFRDALGTASPDDALVLRTQIARAHGLQRRLDEARAELASIEPLLADAGAEPRVRWQLEHGRSWISAVTTPEERTPEALATAAAAYTAAFEIARDAGLDDLAVDAIHMQAFVTSDPDEQIAWNEQGLALALASTEPGARRWETSLRNNLGMALHEAGRHDEALEAFRAALASAEQLGDPGTVNVAWWMIGWELRALGDDDEALEVQLRLERDLDAAGEPDPYVFEELETLYRARGDEERAAHYAARHAEASA